MKFATLIEKPEYKTLEAYVKRLLNDVNHVFGGNHTEFVSFLGYLLISERYKTILNVDRKILLLLRDVDNFWFNATIVKNNGIDPFKELKKVVVLCCVLNYLKAFVNTSSRFKTDSNVNGFIDDRIAEIDTFLEDKDRDIDSIFMDDTEFLKNKGPSISYEIRTDSSIIGMLLLTIGLLSAVVFVFDLIVVILIGWLTQYKGACLDDLIESFEGFFLYSAGFFVFSLEMGSIPFIAKKMLDRSAERALKSLALDEFKTVCRDKPKLVMLMPLIEKSIDSIWLLNDSQLANSPDKNPVMYRTFIHQQWGHLKDDFQEKDYFALMLAAVLSKKIPLFTDTELYTYPMDILRSPKKHWTRGTPLNKLNCKPLLQCYGKLATTEVLLENVSKSKVLLQGNQENLIKFLNTISKKLKQQITVLNSTDELFGKAKIMCMFMLRMVIFLFTVVTGVLLLHSLAHRSPILDLISILTFLTACLVYAENVDFVEKKIFKPIKNFREQWSAIPVAKFIEKYSPLFKERLQNEVALRIEQLEPAQTAIDIKKTA